MTFTYVSPPVEDKDLVRFWSGDAVESAQSVSDEDIEFLLSPTLFNGNIWWAAAEVCIRIADALKALGTSNQPKRIGPFQTSTDNLSKAQAFLDRAARLKLGNPSGAISGPVLTGGAGRVGGTRPQFAVGMQDDDSPLWGSDRLGI